MSAATTATGTIAAAFACEPSVAAVVAGQARYHEFPARATIVAGGVHDDRIYLVLAGHARMLAFSLEGRLIVIEDFTVGDLFGETALLSAEPGRDDVAAVEPVSAATFQAHVMVALMTTHSCIALAISRRLVARLSAATRRLVEGATLSAAGRVHAELLRRARSGSAMTIRPAPVLSELALHVQSTRETVSRTINTLQKRGIIRRDAEALTIVAPHRLEELVY